MLLGLMLVIGVMQLGGCLRRDPVVRRPDHPEEYIAPPDDARYMGPPNYPANLLNQELGPKKANQGLPAGFGGAGSRLGGGMGP
jgi:hypothetical protein